MPTPIVAALRASSLCLTSQIVWCQTYDMSAATRHIASLRDEYAEMTRQRIVDAFVEALEDEGSIAIRIWRAPLR